MKKLLAFLVLEGLFLLVTGCGEGSISPQNFIRPVDSVENPGPPNIQVGGNGCIDGANTFTGC